MSQRITVNTKTLLALAIARELCIKGVLNQCPVVVEAATAYDREQFIDFLTVAVDLKTRLLPEEEKQQIISKVISSSSDT